MISLTTNSDIISQDISDIIRLFYSFDEIILEENENSKISIFHTHKEDGNKWVEFIKVIIDKKTIKRND